MADKIYGEWMGSAEPLPIVNVDHILGAQVSFDWRGRPEFVEFQYRTDDQTYPFQQARMDWSNAMALLSFLKCIQLDSGQPIPFD
ncbi:hypothetical protein [Sphingomonas sp. M1-B02]|uniref:hypothetical protein n=1 Tax=Sphingomonas sp. M1-B02 TaxID=3114300 RepID=UPI002240DF62|nr:hypothetical protein [Sphingomonas sp. S6-11]UZK67817.1 hypothetical protein OKW87_08350 [Sphingomonas sp. S6-11]